MFSYAGEIAGTPVVTGESQDVILDLVPKNTQFSAASHSEKTKFDLDTSELRKRLFAVDLDPKKRPLNAKTLGGSALATPNLRPVKSVKTQTYDTIMI